MKMKRVVKGVEMIGLGETLPSINGAAAEVPTKKDTHMKAIVSRQYSSPDVLEPEEVQKPTPGDDEVLTKVQPASANPGDWHLLQADPFFVRLTGFGFL